jgi:membrane-associated phospholipid phosphatase
VYDTPPVDDADPGQPSAEEPRALPLSTSDSPYPTRAQLVLRDLAGLDLAVFRTIANTPTPTIDEPLRRLSNAANRSGLWLAIAACLALFGGRTGRRAAVRGVVAVGASSVLVNIGLKSLSRRMRPDRARAGIPEDREVVMPSSSSFPSGHAASALAFAGAVGYEMPLLAVPLRLLAVAVAYSRVHTGVHYPGDAVVGALVGEAVGSVVSRSMSA